MAVRVDQVTQAKTGKSLRVMLSGSWYGAALDSGLNGQIGQMIEAEIETGKYGPWIKKWLPSQTAAAADAGARSPVPPPAPIPAGQPAVAAPHETRYAEPSGADNTQPWMMAFVSNTVAHAIAAGHIQTPEGLNAWALKAAQVAANIKASVKT